MDTARDAWLSEKRMAIAGLGEWEATLAGPDADLTRAAAQLVITAYDGALADLGWPWVREADELGVFWLDPEPIREFDGCPGQLAILPVVEALLGGRRVPDLVQLMQRLDQATVELVLAAFTQASRWRRDVALYAFGGDPWAVSGWIAGQRARYAEDVLPDRRAS
jgi:hypothetical protein